MSKPVVASLRPIRVELKKGEQYFWCTCGKSKKQPFCDGTHRETEFRPMKFVAEETKEVFLCACKHTDKKPFCDGAHRALRETSTNLEV